MSNVPAELKYSKEHEWLRKEADGTYTVGITEHAQGCWATWCLLTCRKWAQP